jgi:ArsR family transcriptional regulator
MAGNRRTPTLRPGPKADAAVVARCCHALSDETRLAVLERLRGGEQCVCNLTGLLRTGQSRLSFHLKVLKDAGLVRDRRDGRWIHYSLNFGALEIVRGFLESLQAHEEVS